MRKSLSLNEIRELLSATLDALVNEKTGPDQANAVSNGVGKYLNSYRTQMEYQRLHGTRQTIKGLEDAE